MRYRRVRVSTITKNRGHDVRDFCCTSKEIPAGDDLLSRRVAPQVPSALAGLTAGFGMEPGISPPPKSPVESLVSAEFKGMRDEFGSKSVTTRPSNLIPVFHRMRERINNSSSDWPLLRGSLLACNACDTIHRPLPIDHRAIPRTSACALGVVRSTLTRVTRPPYIGRRLRPRLVT